MTPTPEQLKAIDTEIFAGNKIAAIKIHREATKYGLAESKTWVEARETELRKTSPDRFSAAPKTAGCLGLIIFGVICGTVLGRYLA
jgi:ribosomal protein L7/L12